MKTAKITILVLLLAMPAVVGSTAYAADEAKKEQVQGEPEITFAEKSYDFGFVPEDGGPVTHFFEFTNTGTAPLIIISATASCGCTRPNYPTEPIAPGKKGKIKVTYLPDGRPGEFDKTVKVMTNAKESKKISLKIKGTVKPK